MLDLTAYHFLPVYNPPLARSQTMAITQIATMIDAATNSYTITQNGYTPVSATSGGSKSSSSRSTSCSEASHVAANTDQAVASKKKKKKKSKKTTKIKSNGASKAPEDGDDERPVLCISRNKHWRYISSYHVWILYRPSRSCALNIPRIGSLATTAYRTPGVVAGYQSRPSYADSFGVARSPTPSRAG